MNWKLGHGDLIRKAAKGNNSLLLKLEISEGWTTKCENVVTYPHHVHIFPKEKKEAISFRGVTHKSKIKDTKKFLTILFFSANRFKTLQH